MIESVRSVFRDDVDVEVSRRQPPKQQRRFLSADEAGRSSVRSAQSDRSRRSRLWGRSVGQVQVVLTEGDEHVYLRNARTAAQTP